MKPPVADNRIGLTRYLRLRRLPQHRPTGTTISSPDSMATSATDRIGLQFVTFSRNSQQFVLRDRS
jgi:hypothetical protein